MALALFGLVLHPAPSQAQGHTVRNWHTEDGLPSGHVTALAQTADGYLWVGTLKGLARFDGVRFKVFSTTTTPGLGDSRITSLRTDRDGTLWIGTLDGNLTRQKDGQFEPVRPAVPFKVDENKTWMPDSVYLPRRCSLETDGEGGLWWRLSGRGTARLKDGRWTVFTRTNGLPEGEGRLARDGEGRIWCEADKDLFRFAGERWDSIRSTVPLSGFGWATVATAPKGGLWVADPHGWSYPAAERVQRLTGMNPPHSLRLTNQMSVPPRVEITALHDDRTGRLWVGTRDNGLCYFDAAGRWQESTGHGAATLAKGRITCLFEDNQGNLWVGTVDDGLQRVSAQPLILLPLPGSGQSAWSICATRDDVIWVGTTDHGVHRLEQGQFTQVDGEWGRTVPPVQSLFQDSRDRLWAGTGKGVFQLDGARFRTMQHPLEMKASVSVMFEDRQGRLWFGGHTNLAFIHGEQFTSYSFSAEEDFRAIAEDGTGNLWFGTVNQGLFTLPPGQTQPLVRVTNYPAIDARCLLMDRRQTLWVGGQQSGLFQRGANGDFIKLRGLPSETLYSIVEDTRGYLWLGAGSGIIGISPDALRNGGGGSGPPVLCEHLSMAEGLPHRRCYAKGQPGAARTSDGRLWFPNVDHLAVLDPVRNGLRGLPGTVLVESVLADGKELPLKRGEMLRVRSGARRIEFNYTAPGLSSPSRLRFRYQLAGMDLDWVEAGVQRTAQFSQLPPRNYEFRLMAGGSDGQWHEASPSIRLEVVPRIWERRWVQLLATALLVTLAGGGLAWRQRRRMRVQLERLQSEQRVQKERERIARDIHDDLGARLTQVMLVSELGQRDLDNPRETGDHFAKIGGTTREAVQALDEIVWAVNPKNDSLPRLVRYICRFADECIEGTGIRCWQEVAPDLPNLLVSAERRHGLFCAVKEAFNNILKHSGATEVRLRITCAGQTLRVEIEDNGRGFVESEADLNRSGLNNMRSRLSEAGGRMDLRSAPGQGTCVSYVLPLENARHLPASP